MKLLEKNLTITLSLVTLIGILTSGCAIKPRTFVRGSAGWKEIELRPGLVGQYDEAWQRTVDTIARNWDIELMDKESGYLRTKWLYGLVGATYQRYRGRLTIKYPDVKKSDKMEVKTEAQWLRREPYSWVTGFDSSFQRDVYSALSGRLGRTVPAD